MLQLLKLVTANCFMKIWVQCAGKWRTSSQILISMTFSNCVILVRSKTHFPVKHFKSLICHYAQYFEIILFHSELIALYETWKGISSSLVYNLIILFSV